MSPSGSGRGSSPWAPIEEHHFVEDSSQLSSPSCIFASISNGLNTRSVSSHAPLHLRPSVQKSQIGCRVLPVHLAGARLYWWLMIHRAMRFHR